jgi:phage terminase large subunit GpA-like protein
MNPLASGIRDGIKLAYDGTILDWAEAHVKFPNSDRASRFDRTVAPWMNDVLLAVTDDEATQVFLRASTGSGKTTMMETLACFIVAQKPGPTLFVGQTDDMVKDWTESRLLPIFRDCEPVRALFPEDRHALRKTTIFFPHMVLFAGGANMTNLQEKSMRYCIGDEVWRWKDGMIKELKARHHDRWNRKTFLCSQGGSSTDEMEHEWDSGTREVWGWTCPQCSAWQRYTFDAIKFEQPKNAAGEMLWDQVQDSVFMECEHCKAQYRDTAATRRNLANTATFRSLNPNPVRGHRSFEVPAYAVWWIPWFSIVKEWIEANDAKSNGNLEPLKQFIQKRKAQTWQEEIISDLPEITAGDYSKSEFIDGQKIDGEHRRFLCVDKQRDHFWYVIRAFRMDGSSMLLAEGKILTWETIESLALQYNIPNRAVVIDAGYDTPLVYERCARNGWTASHGSGQDGFSHTESNGRRVKKFVSKIETAVAGSDNLRAFYFFHSNEKIKDKLAAMRQPDAVPKWETPRDASNDYRAQMVAEMKKDIVNSKTKQVETRWVRIGGRPNHLFDCECIALASAMLAGVLPIGSEI